MSANSPHVEVRSEDQQVWRVGYRPHPWAWSSWKYATDGRFHGRWDDPAGNFRTIYAGDTLLACLLEILACFRPDPSLISELAGIDTSDEDPQTAPAGVVPLSWLEPRAATSARMVGRFCAVTHTQTLSVLRPRFLSHAAALGLVDLDAAALKDVRARALTQAIAAELYRSTDLDGIRFASRHGDEHQLWAIFERLGGLPVSPCLTQLQHVALTPDSSDVREAFRLHGLTWDTSSHQEQSPVPLPVVAVDEETTVKAYDDTFGASDIWLDTPLGTAALFWLILQEPDQDIEVLNALVVDPTAWDDYTQAAHDIAPLSIAQHVHDSTDDPRIKHVKFVPLAGNRTVVAFADAPVPDAIVVTVINPPASRLWHVWGYTRGWTPSGAQVRGEQPLTRD